MFHQDERKCVNCTISTQNILKGLNHQELGAISDCKTALAFRKGDVIFDEGIMLGGIYCIRKGICKLSKLSPNGKNQIIRFAGTGDILGKRSVISGEEVNLSATALTDMEVCFIPKREIIGCLNSNHKFSNEVLKNICIELKKADDFIVDLAQKTAKQRLVDAIFSLEKIFGIDTDGYVHTQLSREELGNMIGVAPESLIRILSELGKKGWIDTKTKRIKILNRKQLEKIATL